MNTFALTAAALALAFSANAHAGQTDIAVKSSVNGFLANDAPVFQVTDLGTIAGGSSMSEELATDNDPLTCTVTTGSLPTGLSFTGCTLEGTVSNPNSNVTYSFEVTANDGAYTVTQAYTGTITSVCAAPTDTYYYRRFDTWSGGSGGCTWTWAPADTTCYATSSGDVVNGSCLAQSPGSSRTGQWRKQGGGYIRPTAAACDWQGTNVNWSTGVWTETTCFRRYTATLD